MKLTAQGTEYVRHIYVPARQREAGIEAAKAAIVAFVNKEPKA